MPASRCTSTGSSGFVFPRAGHVSSSAPRNQIPSAVSPADSAGPAIRIGASCDSSSKEHFLSRSDRGRRQTHSTACGGRRNPVTRTNPVPAASDSPPGIRRSWAGAPRPSHRLQKLGRQPRPVERRLRTAGRLSQALLRGCHALHPRHCRRGGRRRLAQERIQRPLCSLQARAAEARACSLAARRSPRLPTRSSRCPEANQARALRARHPASEAAGARPAPAPRRPAARRARTRPARRAPPCCKNARSISPRRWFASWQITSSRASGLASSCFLHQRAQAVSSIC